MFPGTCETVGQLFKFVWRLLWKINVVCMPLSPLVSFLSRFVTYLLTFPRIYTLSELLFFCMLSRKPNTYGILIQMWIEIKSVAWPQTVINLSLLKRIWRIKKGVGLRPLVGSNPTGGMDICRECCVLSGRGLCDGLITRPEESYRLWRVVVCDQEISKTRKLKPAIGLWKNNQNRL
jgi:hypothetical protein